MQLDPLICILLVLLFVCLWFIIAITAIYFAVVEIHGKMFPKEEKKPAKSICDND